MLIKSGGRRQWLSDDRQLDDKRPDHPAREFGHEPVVKGTYDPLTSAESEEQTMLRLKDKLRAIGSLATSTIGHRTVKVERVSYDVPCFRFTIREKGEVVQEGSLS